MASINVRIDENLKKEAESIFEAIGVSTSTAINMFFKQVVRTKKIPFELSSEEIDIPNRTTLRAFKRAEKLEKKAQKDIVQWKN